MMRRRVLLGGLAVLPALAQARAQAAWPASPVTFVVGYAPGGSNDINARELAQLMSPILRQQIVVDNKGGANGSLGLRTVASARPDASSTFLSSSGGWSRYLAMSSWNGSSPWYPYRAVIRIPASGCGGVCLNSCPLMA